MMLAPLVAATCVFVVALARLMFRGTEHVVIAPAPPPAEPVPQSKPQPKLYIPRGLPDLTLEALGRRRRLAAGTDVPPEAREAATVTVRRRAKTVRGSELVESFELEPTHAWTGRQAR